ncbi:MAG: hypothetical protein AB1498_05550 [bacterium]
MIYPQTKPTNSNGSNSSKHSKNPPNSDNSSDRRFGAGVYNKIVESVYAFAGSVSKYDAWQKYKVLLKNQWLSREEIEKLQWKKLKAILDYSYRTVPFYKNKFDRAGIKPEDINTPADMLLIPITTKEELMEEKMPLNPDLKAEGLEWIKTSGTTGTPLNWPFDVKTYSIKYALFLRGLNYTGWQPGDKIASLWWHTHSSYGNESFSKIKKFAYFFGHRRVLFPPITRDSTDADPRLLKYIYDNLASSPPKVFETSTDSLLMFGYFMEENGLKPLKIENIISIGLLTDAIREKLKKYFQGEIFNRYGPHEMEGIGHDCSRHEGLHLSADSYYFECMRGGKPAKPGECGNFVITDLDNYTQPFIRYKIGDRGSFSQKMCPCGRGLPLINYLEGRSADFVINETCRKISPRQILEFFGNYHEVKFFQLIQDGLIKFKLFLIVKNEVYLEADKIKQGLKRVLGNSADIEIIFTKSISAEPSGKFRWVKREI